MHTETMTTDPTEAIYWYSRHREFLLHYTPDTWTACRDLASWSQIITDWSTDQLLADWVADNDGSGR